MIKRKVGTIIEFLSWVVAALLLMKYVPRNKWREATVTFLFKQGLTFLFGLLVVEKNLITYPSRLYFRKSMKSSFTFEYFIYPILCVLFNLHYPKNRNLVIKLLYYALHSSIITGLELIALKYTKLIKYKKWTWYWTFITLWFTFYLSHLYHQWFFKAKDGESVV